MFSRFVSRRQTSSANSQHRTKKRRLRCETLERRELLAADLGLDASRMDLNVDGTVSASDALIVINHLNSERTANAAQSGDAHATAESVTDMDVNVDQRVSALDALQIVNYLNLQQPSPAMSSSVGENVFNVAKATGVGSVFNATLSDKDSIAENLLNKTDVETLLQRASQATASNDAIIAVVDRSGRILGVRVEDGVSATLQGDPKQLAFAIDGAVAKARTAAFFSSNEAPLTSRTIRFISQSTVTQREVESSPRNDNDLYRGPGFVAPIGVGGHFPPEVSFTPQVDLFAIEHQSRDSQTHPGPDGDKSSVDDNFELQTRFNADPQFVPSNAEDFFRTWPESYGEQSGTDNLATPRGIATLPGGVPLYKITKQKKDNPNGTPLSEATNLVGGIGVFFPGEDGFATHEQGFVHGIGQTEKERTNADKVLEAEYTALVASAGGGIISGMNGFARNINSINAALPAQPDFVALSGRIDLVGITLEIYGPTPSRAFRMPGIDRLLQFGQTIGPGLDSGTNQRVTSNVGETLLDGQPVPEGWLVAPHDSPTGSGLTAADVQQIIDTGVAEANRTRAAIRLDIDGGFRPGAKTGMVLSVADTNGELLGLFRMPDATIFSIDVAVAKARNTAYYADPNALQDADRVDFNGDGTFGSEATSLNQSNGDTLPLGTALTSRSFRFLVEPRFPTGTELDQQFGQGCDFNPTPCLEVGPQSMLRLPGIHPNTAENLGDGTPLAFDVYASAAHSSTKAFDAFNVMRNFRDLGDDDVEVYGADKPLTVEQKRLANQNGVVFFPGSTSLYAGNNLAGGFGVSGDGVDQDDVVTFAGQEGFAPDPSIRVDAYTIGGVRVPFQKFNRNPFAN